MPSVLFARFILLLVSIFDILDYQPSKESTFSQIQLAQFIKQLGSDLFEEREQATKKLVQAGKVAVKKVAQIIETDANTDVEVRQRCIHVLSTIAASPRIEDRSAALEVFQRIIQKSSFSQLFFRKLVKLGASSQADVSRSALDLLGFLTVCQNEKIAQQAQQEIKLKFPWLLEMAQKFDAPGNPNIVELFFYGLATETELRFSESATDNSLVHLKRSKYLRELNLVNTKISDVGLAKLKNLSHLQKLWLNNKKITDSGLGHLKGLKDLRELSLMNTNISNKGLAVLKNMNELKILRIHCTQVGDDGLIHLKFLTSLRSLTLSQTRVSDKGLEHLRMLHNLQHLDLSDTQVSDNGLVCLKSLTQLKMLNLLDTQFSAKGVAELKKLLPECGIDY